MCIKILFFIKLETLFINLLLNFAQDLDQIYFAHFLDQIYFEIFRFNLELYI